jgi:hypothetical protein
MECVKTPFQKFSQKGTSQNGIPEPFSPGSNITNTSPSPTKFWATLCVPEPIFFRKIALVLILHEYLENINIYKKETYLTALTNFNKEHSIIIIIIISEQTCESPPPQYNYREYVNYQL